MRFIYREILIKLLKCTIIVLKEIYWRFIMDNYNENFFNINELPKIRNGRIWYVSVLPLFGCYLENFAVNIYLGALLWIMVILICSLVCALDEKQLRSFGMSNHSLHKVRFIPPIYLFKRLSTTRQSNTPFIIFIVFSAYAVLNNGFVQALRVDDDTFVRSVKSAYVSTLSDYSDSTSYNTIENQINAFANENTVNWEYSEDDDNRYVTASGKCSYNHKNNQRFELVFQIDFDGYALKETKVKSLSIGGKQLTDSERDSALYKILIEDPAKKNNNERVSDDGQANYKKA